MEHGFDLEVVPRKARTARLLDVSLLFAGANVVTTTLVTGGALAPAFSWSEALLLIVVGVLIGTAPIAWLARLGPRYGLPTMVLLRHPFGVQGARLISLLLVTTNFAWIALNNVIAADAMAALTGRRAWGWNVLLGGVAIGVAWLGPRAMAKFDRFAVPLLALVGVAMTVALLGEDGRRAWATIGDGSVSWLGGLDLVVGYQISWSLMFADYTRFQRRETRASLAVLLGLGGSSLWLMAIGSGAGILGGGGDPTEMVLGLGLPSASLLLLALSTITTNFVNIYLSALALKNLRPSLPSGVVVPVVGVLGTALGLASPALLDRYAGFMGWIATLLLPTVAIAAVHYMFPRQLFVRGLFAKGLLAKGLFAIGLTKAGAAESSSSNGVRIDPENPPRWRWSALFSWAAGAGTYQALTYQAAHRTVEAGTFGLGATLPTLLVAAVCFLLSRNI